MSIISHLFGRNPDETKVCTKCGKEKLLSEFAPRGDSPSTPRSHCLECKRADKVAYRARNIERVQASDARYREANRQEINERYRQWRADHPDQIRAIESKARQKNAEARRTYNHRYQRENKARYNAYWHARRARKLANGGSHTAAEWEECKAYFDYHCLMCGRREPEIRLTIDHIVPIALGGTDDIANIQPLCQRCNSSKSDTVMDLRPDWE